MRSGRRSRPGSCTGPGSLPRATTWGCGGWRSGMPPITFTSWRRWPARTAPGPRSGTTSTGSGRPARTPSAGSGCAVLLRRIAPRRGAPPAPRRSRRPAAGGVSRPGPPCAARCAPQPPERARSRSSSPASRQAGVLVRLRHSVTNPGEVTGYAVGLPAAHGQGRRGDLVRRRQARRRPDPAQAAHPLGQPGRARPGRRDGTAGCGGARLCCGAWSPGPRNSSPDEASFFARLREAGVLVRLRFSETDPGQVTGYAVTLPGHTGPDGAPAWYGGGRLAAGLTLPRLRDRWSRGRSSSAEHAGNVPVHRPGTRRHLRPRVPPGRCGGGAHPPLRPQ